MKKTVKNRWVKALRSGQYAQTRGLLHRYKDEDDRQTPRPQQAGYCCLGVLCEISGIAEWRAERGTYIDNGLHYDGALRTLPEKVRRWAGLRTGAGQYEETEHGHLARLNDSGKSFDEIADVIETHWREM